MRQAQHTRHKIFPTFSAHLRGFSSTHCIHHPVKLASLNNQPTGDANSSLIILHGLFGSKRNWTSFHKAFRHSLPQHSIHALDLRNHGASPRAIPMTYDAMAEDVLHYIELHKLTDISLLGHSMGGKVAMALALSLSAKGREDLLSHLLVSDITPTRTQLSPDFVKYIDAMNEVNDLPLGSAQTRSDIDRLLQTYEPDLNIRQFLMTNLVFPSAQHIQQKPYFVLPLDILKQAIPELGSFPYDPHDHQRPQWNGKTLIFRGLKSTYINDNSQKVLKNFFPNSRVETLDTGHWIHAEKPHEFKDLVIKFIQS